jgi:hypothetical protein
MKLINFRKKMDHKLTGQEENGNTGLHYERRECSERKIQYSKAQRL